MEMEMKMKMELNLGELIDIEIQVKDPNQFEKARVKWIFENGEIRGGRITDSQYNDEGLWVQLPKYKSNDGKWVHVIKLEDYLRESLEEQTLNKYLEL